MVRPRLVAGLSERGRTILGEPGLGKSTLVRKIAQQTAREHGDWVTRQIRIPLGADPFKGVSAALLEVADRVGLAASREQRIQSVLDRVRQVSIRGVAISLDRAEGVEPHTALTELMIELGKAAIAQNRVLLIHVDEVQNITDDAVISQLLVSFGDAITHEITVDIPGGERQRSLPISVYLTGLPEFAERASSRTGATFARRFQTTTLEPLSDADIELALVEFIEPGWPVPDNEGGISYVRMTPEAVSLIVELCCGEPFLFQLAGQRAWYSGMGTEISAEDVKQGWKAAAYEASAHVERILERLPEREAQFVHAMAELDPADRTSTTIARKLGYQNAQSVGAFAQRLDTVRGIIHRGKQYRFRHRALEAYLSSDWPNLF